MKDKIGNEITIGCFIAYGHAMNRSAGLRIGRVEALKTKIKKDWDKKYEAYSITVLGIDDDFGKSNKPKLLSKRSTILFPDRVIVVPNIPEHYLKLFENNCLGEGGTHVWDNPKEYRKKCKVCGYKYSW